MWRFRTVFSVAHHLSILWTRLIHCTLPHPVYFKVHWNIDLLRTPRSSELPLSSWFPHQNTVCISFLPHMCYMSCPSHPSLIALMIYSAEYKLRSSILCSFRHLCTFCHLGRKCLPWHPVLQTLLFFTLWETYFYTRTNKQKICSSSYTSKFYEDQASSKWISVDCVWRFKYSGTWPGPRHASLPFVRNRFHPNTQRINGKQNFD